MIRVLIVDDSPTLRFLIRNILTSDAEIEVAGEAKNGEEAFLLCKKLNPDVITMDIHMPKVDGYQAIQRIMAEYPRPIIILTSTESDIRLGITYRGLEAGALMVYGKPHGLPGEDPEADDLVRVVKAMSDVKVVRRRLHGNKPIVHPMRRQAGKSVSQGLKIIAIGSSTGGPPALKTILEELPATYPLPIVVVQHISKGFTEGLVKWLDSVISLHVKLATNGEPLVPGTVYVAPDDIHFKVTRDLKVKLNHEDIDSPHCPSVNVLFHSVAEQFHHSAVGVLLTGMGRDGAEGLLAIKSRGGFTIAQDQSSSIVFGMPKEAIVIGAACEVLPLDHIGVKLREIGIA
jgi:two-component system chemotaxis response regulator CheB